MTSKKHSMIMGYARRMYEVATMATEMNSIASNFKREFGTDINDHVVTALSGESLARLHSELRADAPVPAPQASENVLEPVSDTPPGAPALGLAPAPGWVLESPLRHFHGGTECGQAWADCLIARGETEVPGV
jgi:hypothetical protein